MAEINNHRLIINVRSRSEEKSLFKKIREQKETDRDVRRKVRMEKKQVRLEIRRKKNEEHLRRKYGEGGIILSIKPKFDRRRLLLKSRLKLAA